MKWCNKGLKVISKIEQRLILLRPINSTYRTDREDWFMEQIKMD